MILLPTPPSPNDRERHDKVTDIDTSQQTNTYTYPCHGTYLYAHREIVHLVLSSFIERTPEVFQVNFLIQVKKKTLKFHGLVLKQEAELAELSYTSSITSQHLVAAEESKLIDTLK
jgi:hypothetical protein